MSLSFLLAAALLAAPCSASSQSTEQTIYTSVVDGDGAPVAGLTASDFIVREDGVAREVIQASPDTGPLQIALLVDNSQSMRLLVTELRRAVASFIDATRPDVPVALITLAERPTIAVPYTRDHGAIRKAAAGLFAHSGGTYLLDGIAETSQGLSKRPAWRSAIAVITGNGPELSHRQYTTVLRLFREGGASLHVLSLGMGARSREIVLGNGTAETGGRYQEILSPRGFELQARHMAAELSNQYRVVYARPDRLIPPAAVEVAVKRPGVKARNRLLKKERDR